MQRAAKQNVAHIGGRWTSMYMATAYLGDSGIRESCEPSVAVLISACAGAVFANGKATPSMSIITGAGAGAC